MLEEQEAWKREAGFDRIEIITQMDAQRFYTGFDTKPFYTKLYSSMWPHTPEEHAFEMRVDIERLRMGVMLSQSTPPLQYDSSPRRSPTVGARLDKSGAPHDEPH